MRMLSPFLAGNHAADWFDEVDRLFDRTPTGPKSERVNASQTRWFQPESEVTETDEQFVLSLDLPGLNREDIKVEVNNNILSISGERKERGQFSRSFKVPNTVRTDKVQASYENGVLELSLPKAEIAKPRTIEIKVKDGSAEA